MKTVIISAHYECDGCNMETADTDGDIPAGWKEGSRIDSSEDDSSSVEVRVHVGPDCVNSEDPAVILAVRDLFCHTPEVVPES